MHGTTDLGRDRPMLPNASLQEHTTRAVELPRSVEILDVPLALTDYGSMIALMDEFVSAGERGYVCVANVHSVMASKEDPELAAALLGSSVNVPDGQPLVWAINLLGNSLGGRVYGPELMWRSCAHAATSGQRLYLYGGRNQGALVQLALNLRKGHPGLKIVGGYSPPHRPLTEEENEAVIAEINHAKPDIIWVGIGVPKQEKWMARMRPRLDAPLLLGVGAAFDFHAGLVPQAPNWVQNAGMEWAFRLAQEPRRLWKRYLKYNPRFVLSFAAQLGRHRSTRSLKA
jgi:N-acetylglucosaminyldiphosphoundecaprenol N-acetyl-beta-D-mannosaminyltransferase